MNLTERFSFPKPDQRYTMIKIIAVISMLIDHIGVVFFPDMIEFRILGRLAFPLFAYQAAIGLNHTSDTGRYFLRLFSFALLSQLPFMVLFNTTELNVLFTLSFAVLLVHLYNKMRSVQDYELSSFFIILLIFFSLVVHQLASTPGYNYGIFGVSLVFCFYISQRFFSGISGKLVSSICFALLTLSFADQYGILHYFGLFAIPFFFINPQKKFNINKYFYYAIYPLCLIILWGTVYVFNL
ncbi:MAG: hypothetical protein D3906_02505 [Candidatus Electrothrix sp. AUS1_2]|nr:hypothetical protein [Candidatus Electrothrix sp. AUS1_2]